MAKEGAGRKRRGLFWEGLLNKLDGINFLSMPVVYMLGLGGEREDSRRGVGWFEV